MMVFCKETSTSIENHRRSTRPRYKPISVSDPKLRSHSLIQSTHTEEPTISTFFNNNNNTSKGHSNKNVTTLLIKKNKFMPLPLGGLGCVSSSPAPVSASEIIRLAADWEAKKMEKKKKKKKEGKKNNMTVKTGIFSTTSPVVVEVLPDVCCAPGIGFASDATLVDCVEPRRPVAPKTNHRERHRIGRRSANLEYYPVLESPIAFDAALCGSSRTNGMQYRRLRHQSPGDLSKIMRFQNSSSLLFGRNFDGYDRFGDWRLDIDNMSYEELLDLSERIGNVGTGLREDEIFRCLRKTKHSILNSFPLLFPTDKGWNCCICQEECHADDEMGKLDCGHCYHINCIKQWLLHKNTCPVCKATAAAAANN